MTNLNSTHSKRFLKTISPWMEGYSEAGMSFHAKRSSSGLQLLHARIWLRGWKDPIPKSYIEFDDQVVAHIPLASLAISIPELIRRIEAGESFDSPHGSMQLFNPMKNPVGQHGFDFHQEGLPFGKRIGFLQISGDVLRDPVNLQDRDWALKANNPPFDGFWEVQGSVNLNGYSGGTALVEFFAHPVVEIDESSVVDGTVATPSMLLASNCKEDQCKISFRQIENGVVSSRGEILGSSMSWEVVDHPAYGVCKRGSSTIPIPSTAALHCYASFGGVVQHQYWLGDPKQFPNWRRAVYEECDPEAEELLARLFDPKRHRDDARIIERGVVRLLWLLGFSPIHVDGKRNERAPDLLAVTPKGRLVVVECTTGIIDSDKLRKLASRAATIEAKLRASSAVALEVAALLITSLRREGLSGLDQASELRVAVVSREDLDAAVDRASFVQDPDGLLDELVGRAGWRPIL